MIGYLKGLFSSDKKGDEIDDQFIKDIKSKIMHGVHTTPLPKLQLPATFVEGNKTVIILDDNQGATMLFDDDIRWLKRNRKDIAEHINFVKISTPQAVFILESGMKDGVFGEIAGAVLDITIGGYGVRDEQTVMFDGIDAYQMIRD